MKIIKKYNISLYLNVEVWTLKQANKYWKCFKNPKWQEADQLTIYKAWRS